MSAARPVPPAPAARTHFAWDDPFHLDGQLGEDERMIRDTARDYAQSRLQPRVTRAYLDETSDPSIFVEMGALGLLGVTVGEAYGGAGCIRLKPTARSSRS